MACCTALEQDSSLKLVFDGFSIPTALSEVEALSLSAYRAVHSLYPLFVPSTAY